MSLLKIFNGNMLTQNVDVPEKGYLANHIDMTRINEGQWQTDNYRVSGLLITARGRTE